MNDRLDQRYFSVAVAAAMLLHLLGAIGWGLLPHQEVVDVPVRALNIKLGDAEMPDKEEIASVTHANDASNAAVENTISKMVQNEKTETTPASKSAPVSEKATPAKPRSESVVDKGNRKFDVRSEGIAASAPVSPVTVQQFVRDLPAPKTDKGKGSALGNSNSRTAELISRYEQLISLWIQKFKQYPEEARAAGMSGETVIRIRIDRRGNIGFYTLERSTGHQVLDRAAIDMIRRANPVPAVPTEYPPGDALEFLIPVNFQLQ